MLPHLDKPPTGQKQRGSPLRQVASTSSLFGGNKKETQPFEGMRHIFLYTKVCCWINRRPPSSDRATRTSAFAYRSGVEGDWEKNREQHRVFVSV